MDQGQRPASPWSSFPDTYRLSEVRQILKAAQAGSSVAVIGLSGSGKSNLLGFLANRPEVITRHATKPPELSLVDCNRLPERSGHGLFVLLLKTLNPGGAPPEPVTLEQVQTVLEQRLETGRVFCLLLDRLDSLSPGDLEPLSANLRALRDSFKYRLVYVVATRRPLSPTSELAELFHATTLWLGPLSAQDALWDIQRHAARWGQDWRMETIERIHKLSGGYPALVKAVSEAHAAGSGLEPEELVRHPAVASMLAEFWADEPSTEALRSAGLSQIPLLIRSAVQPDFDTTSLTAKEHLLWKYLQAHPEEICSKDDLIQAVWPEDKIYAQGIRDDSLAQLIRRLRAKIEPDPSRPRYIQTMPGRGYRFMEKGI